MSAKDQVLYHALCILQAFAMFRWKRIPFFAAGIQRAIQDRKRLTDQLPVSA